MEDGIDYYPFGAKLSYSSTSSGNLYTFTGDETDMGESSTMHTPFRQFSPSLGRWMIPDPYDGSYDLSNPQSLNRYAYVNGTPEGATDPSGLEGGTAACAFGPIGCVVGIATDLFVGAEFDNWLLSLFGGSSFHGRLGPRPGASDPGSLGESLGIPINGPPLQNPGILGALGFPSQQCEFGACGSVVFNATNGQTSTIGPTTGATTFSGILAVIYGVAGPAINVSWAPTKKMLCIGGGIGVSAGHTLSGGPVVVHAKQGKTIKDVLSSWSFGGGYNWLPWAGSQVSANTSGGTAGISFGIPGASGTLTYSGCHVFSGGSE